MRAKAVGGWMENARIHAESALAARHRAGNASQRGELARARRVTLQEWAQDFHPALRFPKCESFTPKLGGFGAVLGFGMVTRSRPGLIRV